MRMNRRNVLLGLGTIVAGGGGALATGAFSSVEASRTIHVDVVGDSDALLAINVDPSVRRENGTGEVGIDLTDPGTASASGLNMDAKTRFNAALALTNQGTDPVNLTVPESATADSGVSVNIDGSQPSGDEVTVGFELNDGGGSGYDLDTGPFDPPADTGTGETSDTSVGSDGTVVYDLVVDLTGSALNENDNFTIDMTIKAESS